MSMEHEHAPDGTPLTQEEWDCLSEGCRRWIWWLAAALKEKERKAERAKPERVAKPAARPERV